MIGQSSVIIFLSVVMTKMNLSRSNIFDNKEQSSNSVGQSLWILIIVALFLGPLPAITESSTASASETEDVYEDAIGGIGAENLRRIRRQGHSRLRPKFKNSPQFHRLEIKTQNFRSVDGHRLRHDLLAPLRC